MDRESASLPMKDSTIVSLHKDHIKLVKFKDDLDPDYKTVLGVVRAVVENDMLSFTERNWRREVGHQG